jgi:hypothetical protein
MVGTRHCSKNNLKVAEWARPGDGGEGTEEREAEAKTKEKIEGIENPRESQKASSIFAKINFLNPKDEVLSLANIYN